MPLLVCDKCKTILPGAVVNHTEPVACPGCFALLRAQVFPAFFRVQTAGAAAENVLSDEDASCFYHPAKKAVVPCGRCGRFLCALCDLELGPGQHVCPGCLNAGKAAPGKPVASAAPLTAPVILPPQRRVLHDQLALLLTVFPCLFVFWYASILTAPVALFLVIRYWNEPRTAVLPRTRARLIVAGVLALLQIGGWITLGVYFFNHHPNALG